MAEQLEAGPMIVEKQTVFDVRSRGSPHKGGRWIINLENRTSNISGACSKVFSGKQSIGHRKRFHGGQRQKGTYSQSPTHGISNYQESIRWHLKLATPTKVRTYIPIDFASITSIFIMCGPNEMIDLFLLPPESYVLSRLPPAHLDDFSDRSDP